jgi:carboxyl-terminal processing protease
MPKRNLVLLCLLSLACLLAWAARDRGGRSRLYGEVTRQVGRMYLEQVDDEALFHGAMEGLFNRLDGQSAFVAGHREKDPADESAAEFAGVGLELTCEVPDRFLTVTTPLVGSPAWRAGLAAGDRILLIDGRPTREMRFKEAVAALRGPAGSKVTVDIAPPANDVAETFDDEGHLTATRSLTLERTLMRAETVGGDRRRADGSWEWLVEGEEGVALVRIGRFGPQTIGDLDRAIEEIGAGGPPAGLILDLRGNPGGSLAVAIDVCDRFLDEGVIVSTRRRPAVGTRPLPGTTEPLDVRRATPGAALREVPMAVLVDGATASAGEIVAACLQDHGRALIVGSRTFGKGTVQSTVPLSDGRSHLRLTTSEYLRPSLATIHRHPDHSDEDSWGVSPDRGFEIAPTGATLEAVRGWRMRRDAVPRHPAAEASGLEALRAGEGSAATIPRYVDPVIGLALSAIESRRALAEAAR